MSAQDAEGGLSLDYICLQQVEDCSDTFYRWGNHRPCLPAAGLSIGQLERYWKKGYFKSAVRYLIYSSYGIGFRSPKSNWCETFGILGCTSTCVHRRNGLGRLDIRLLLVHNDAARSWKRN